MMRILTACVLSLLTSATPSAHAQATTSTPSGTLHVGMIQTKGYVVGSQLDGSGLARLNRLQGANSTWELLGFSVPRVSAISFDPSNASRVFLANGNGLVRSLDGGATWRIVTPWQVTEAQDIMVDPNDVNAIYAATAYGIWGSQDGGDSWLRLTPTDMMDDYTQSLVVDYTQTGRIIAGQEGGVRISDDRGATWQETTLRGMEVMEVAQDARRGGHFLAATLHDGLYRSTDGARTWSAIPLTSIVPPATAAGERAREGRTGVSVYSAAFDPTRAGRLVAAGWETGVLYSGDDGETWTQIGTSLPAISFYQVAFDPKRSGRIWAATVEQGLFYTDNQGRTWQSAGLDGTLIFDLSFSP